MPVFTWTPESREFDLPKQKLLEYYVTMQYATSQLCINAFERVARSLFVPDSQRFLSYRDNPLPIGHGQTISAPHMAFMECQALGIEMGDKILEIGSGSGYHASICAEMCTPSNRQPSSWKPLTQYYNDQIYKNQPLKRGQVTTVERLNSLVKSATDNIKSAGYADRITVIEGDGTTGFEPQSPYDKILVTAAGPKVPTALKNQLKIGGRLIIPVGEKNFHQDLLLIERISENKWTQTNIGAVVFVPLIGEHGFKN